MKADGTDQKVSGSHEFDTRRVQVIDDHTVRITDSNARKVYRIQNLTVSKDGAHVTDENTMHPENQPVTGTTVFSRIEKAPAGSHAISGMWKADSISDNISTITFKSTGDGLTFTQPGVGVSYTAKFDGKDYPFRGDPNEDAVSLRRVDANTIEETDKKDGKVVEVDRMTVSPDGRSMAIVSDDKVTGRTNKYSATKQ